MPNWTKNVLIFKKKEDFEGFLSKYVDEEGDVNFNRIILRPEELNDTISGGKIMECIACHLFSIEGKDKALEIVKEIDKNFHVPNIELTAFEIKAKLRERCFNLRMFNSEYETGAKKEYTPEEIGEHYYNLYLKYGHIDWYTWSCENWGTKWNACDTYIDDKKMMISFDTAWSRPCGIYKKIAEDNPDWDIQIRLAYENGGKYNEKIRKGKYIKAA